MHSSVLIQTLLYSLSLLISSLCSFIFLPSLVSLWQLLWILLGRLLIAISFCPLFEILSYSFIWNIFLCHLILNSSLCLVYILGNSAASPGLEGVSLWKIICGAQKYNSPCSPEPMLSQWYSLCVLQVPSCYFRATTAIHALISRVDLHPSWVQNLTITVVRSLVCSRHLAGCKAQLKFKVVQGSQWGIPH